MYIKYIGKIGNFLILLPNDCTYKCTCIYTFVFHTIRFIRYKRFIHFLYIDSFCIYKVKPQQLLKLKYKVKTFLSSNGVWV